MPTAVPTRPDTPATTPPTTTARPPRRRSLRLWVPNQHGAWAMILLPVVVGSVRGELGWVHLWLGAAWLTAYLAYFATTVWLRSGRKARYARPVQVYGAALAVVGGGLLVAEPQLVRWGVVIAPLLALSLGFAARRDERALANDVLTVVATSTMAVVAYGLGSRPDAAFLPGADHVAGWALAGSVAAYLVGTAFYVKTMIRERGNRVLYVASVIYHVGVAILFAWWLPFVGAFLAVMAVKACVVPSHWPGARPVAIGVGEVLASVLLGVVLLTLPLV